MKREKYFRDELQRMFLIYAVIPCAAATLVCGLVFMAVILCGRGRSNQKQNQQLAGRLERILQEYSRGVTRLEEVEPIFTEGPSAEGRQEIYRIVYEIANELGCQADMYILDEERSLCLTNTGGEVLPDFLNPPGGASWGFLREMELHPGEVQVRLVDGWRRGESAIALGSLRTDSAGRPEGYVVFSLGGRHFEELLEHQEAQTMIADRFGWAFLSNNRHFLTESNQVAYRLRQSGPYLISEHHLYLTDRRTIWNGAFTVYSAVDIQNLAVSLAVGGGLVLAVLGIMTAWVCCSSRRATEKKTEDFYTILEVLRKNRDGSLDSLLGSAIHISSDNEFKIIADAYNETISSLRGQMEYGRKMTELAAASQNKQLESQFNPHFLYNTLENIRYMCRLEPGTAERMVFHLSQLLRYSLDGDRREVTLREDLEHLKSYLAILERRFGERLSCRIDVTPEAERCRIPKLVLQPLIENSVKYGFGSRMKLQIELKAYVHEGRLVMICRDDGVGMARALVSQLTLLLEQTENPGRHSGLYNIHRRIRLLYGSPYGVEIRSAEESGTTLVVVLPAAVQGGEENAARFDCGG